MRVRTCGNQIYIYERISSARAFIGIFLILFSALATVSGFADTMDVPVTFWHVILLAAFFVAGGYLLLLRPHVRVDADVMEVQYRTGLFRVHTTRHENIHALYAVEIDPTLIMHKGRGGGFHYFAWDVSFRCGEELVPVITMRSQHAGLQLTKN